MTKFTLEQVDAMTEKEQVASAEKFIDYLDGKATIEEARQVDELLFNRHLELLGVTEAVKAVKQRLGVIIAVAMSICAYDKLKDLANLLKYYTSQTEGEKNELN